MDRQAGGIPHAVYENRRRTKRGKSKKLQRLRSERCERTFAHVCDSGGMRRSWLRGLVDVTKRYVIAAAAHNLSRIMWSLFKVGKPRSLQGIRPRAALAAFLAWIASPILRAVNNTRERPKFPSLLMLVLRRSLFATGC